MNSILSKLKDSRPILEDKSEDSIDVGNQTKNEALNKFSENAEKSVEEKSHIEDKTMISENSKKTHGSFTKRIAINDGIDIIKEANKIMAERHKKTGDNSGKVKAKTQQIIETREVCLKNYLIGLLKERRMEINDKELAITKALKESENTFDRDYKDFLRLMEEEKNRTKERDSEYLALKNNNDAKKKKEKELETEYNQIKGELERTVKSIQSYKSTAYFVHDVVGEPFQMFKESEKFEKDKDFERLASNIIKDFTKIDLEFTCPDFFFDTNLFTGKFIELEEKVLKLMEKQDNDDKEFQLSSKTQAKEVEELKIRVENVIDERNKLLKEKEKELRALKALEQLNFDDNCKEYYEYIHALYDIIDPGHKKARKREENFNPIWATRVLEKLREKETQVIKKISKLQELFKEDKNKLREKIGNRREENKKKLQESKQAEMKQRKIENY
jgi:hypothetical protein